MSTPKRIQRQRMKGWRMPEGAVYVGRPSKWGNPFGAGEVIAADDPRWPWLVVPGQPADLLRGLSSVRLYRKAAVEVHGWWFIQQPHLMASLEELHDKDLACWCPLDQPCHADVLLELANAPATPPSPVEENATGGAS